MLIDEREMLAYNLGQLRRAIWQDMLFSTLRSFGDADFSLVQVATLYLLDDAGELSVKQVAEEIGRSVSAASRLLEQLVERGLIDRREDRRDRRAKQVLLTEEGRAFLRTFERNRANAQLAVMAYLSPEEQARINEAMKLLAEAARRSSKKHEHAGTTAEDF